jgi:hypothetical protein
MRNFDIKFSYGVHYFAGQTNYLNGFNKSLPFQLIN